MDPNTINYMQGKSNIKQLIEDLSPIKARSMEERRWQGKSVTLGKIIHEFNDLINKFLESMGIFENLGTREATAQKKREGAIKVIDSDVRNLTSIMTRWKKPEDKNSANIDIAIYKEMIDKLARMKNIVTIISESDQGGQAETLIDDISELIQKNNDRVKSCEDIIHGIEPTEHTTKNELAGQFKARNDAIFNLVKILDNNADDLTNTGINLDDIKKNLSKNFVSHNPDKYYKEMEKMLDELKATRATLVQSSLGNEYEDLEQAINKLEEALAAIKKSAPREPEDDFIDFNAK